MAWSHEPPGPEIAPDFARALARKLCRDSLAWAKTLVASVRPSRTRLRSGSGGKSDGVTPSLSPRLQLEDELFVEVLAYGLCLLEMRSAAASPADGERLVRLVRHECGVIVERASWRRRSLRRHLPRPAPAPGSSRYAQIYPAWSDDDRGQPRLTREMFEHFCRCTGLGSDVLVGKGENLASLVFYVSVHGVLSAGGLPSREEVLKLLQAARECRTRLQGAISEWLATEPKARASLAALPDSRS